MIIKTRLPISFAVKIKLYNPRGFRVAPLGTTAQVDRKFQSYVQFFSPKRRLEVWIKLSQREVVVVVVRAVEPVEV